MRNIIPKPSIRAKGRYWKRGKAVLLLIAMFSVFLYLSFIIKTNFIEDPAEFTSVLTRNSINTTKNISAPSGNEIISRRPSGDKTSPSMPTTDSSKDSTNTNDSRSAITGWSFYFVEHKQAPSASDITGLPVMYSAVISNLESSSSSRFCKDYLKETDDIDISNELLNASFAANGSSILSVREYARRSGPDLFEGFANIIYNTPEGTRGVGVPLSFYFDRTTCSYHSEQLLPLTMAAPSLVSGQPLTVGETSFIYISHLHERYNAINEAVEKAHYPYLTLGDVHTNTKYTHTIPQSSVGAFPRLPFKSEVCSGTSSTGGQSHTDNVCPFSLRFDLVQEVWRLEPPALPTTAPPVASLVHVLAMYNRGLLEGKGTSHWATEGRDPYLLKHSSVPQYREYYLKYKGLKMDSHNSSHSDGGTDGVAAVSKMDLLGRLDYGTVYKWGGHSKEALQDRFSAQITSFKRDISKSDKSVNRSTALPSECVSPIINNTDEMTLTPSKKCLVSLLTTGTRYNTRHAVRRVDKGVDTRGGRIVFIGDSHIRTFYYGVLARLGIPFPPNRVWRGDRSDTVRDDGNNESKTATLQFISSPFLEFDKPSVRGILGSLDVSAGGKDIIVMGLGQHHTTHCWSLGKHSQLVREAIDIARGVAVQFGVGNTTGDRREGVSDTNIIWFGVPAQPYNVHLYTPKPVGQSRKDCRNNIRHYLFNEEQRFRLASTSSGDRVSDYVSLQSNKGSDQSMRLGARIPSVYFPNGIPQFIDGYAMSLGMQHTSLDGAHYYTWVREAWIDELIVLMLEMRNK